jgi:hypothetical protein
LDPRQDQEARIVDDEIEVFLALFMAPTDETITGCGLPSGSAKA